MSNTVFVVKNQQGLYLNKQQEWVDGLDSQSLYRTRHRDEAINTIFEVSSRDIYLRAETLVCTLDGKNNPVLASAEPATAVSKTKTSVDEPVEPESDLDATEEAVDAGEPTPAP